MAESSTASVSVNGEENNHSLKVKADPKLHFLKRTSKKLKNAVQMFEQNNKYLSFSM